MERTFHPLAHNYVVVHAMSCGPRSVCVFIQSQLLLLRMPLSHRAVIARITKEPKMNALPEHNKHESHAKYGFNQDLLYPKAGAFSL